MARLRSRAGEPILSVIMPMYNVERYVRECLDSVLSQDFAALEVIVVDDGSTDGSAAIVRAAAGRDPRVRLRSQANAGQGPARNLAISQARGTFLAFVDSDDVVPPGSFRYLVDAMERSGSDFAVAGVRRLEGDRTFRPSWSVIVHDRDRVGITIDGFPPAMADVVAHHRIFRREFWTQRIGDFSAGVYEDHVPMVAAYLRASRFDLLSRVVYEWRLRDEGTSTGQQKHERANLETRVRVMAEARELVWGEASPAVRAAWIGRVLNIDFPPYVEQALASDDGYRRTLQEALTTYVGLATPEALAHVRVRQKIRTYLASIGSWEALADAERVFDELGSIPPTVIRDGRVMLARSPVAATGVTLPDAMLELAESESRLQVCLAGCEVVEGPRLRLTGWAVIRGVDLTDRTPDIRLELREQGGSRVVGLEVEPMELPDATAWVGWPHGAFDRAGFRTEIRLSDLAAGNEARWRLVAHVDVDGVERSDGAYHAVAGSSASRAALERVRVRVGAAIAEPRFDRELGFAVLLRPSSGSGG